MVRLRKWFQDRPVRVGARIDGARRSGGISIRDIYEAFHDVTDDPPGEGDARLIAAVLAEKLKAGEALYLLSEAKQQLTNMVRDSVEAAEMPLRSRLAELRKREEQQTWEETTLAELRTKWEVGSEPILGLALALQALVWAILPPGEDQRTIQY